MSSITLSLSLRGRLLSGTQTTLQGTLFGNGEPGFTFEPWDITTLYQDRAGATPVTAAGQSVGLRLDKSQQTSWIDVTGAVWTKTAGDGVVSVVGDQITITGATTATQVTRTAGSVPFAAGRARATVRADYSAATGVNFWFRGAPAALSNGAATTRYARLDNSSLERFDVSSGTATLTIVGFSFWRGNHQEAINDASRGIYGCMPKTGRRNLLTYSEQFDNAAWTKTNATVTANAAVAPDGTMTADKLIESAGVNRGRLSQSLLTAVGNTISVYAKAVEWNRVSIGITNNSGLWGVGIFNLSNGTVDGNTSYGGDLVDTLVITSVGNGWYRCSVRVAAGSSSPVIMPFNQSGDPVNPSPALTGDGTSGILIWGAQLETGSTATAYQRVNSQYDVTEAGVPTCYYVQADGVDDAYVTPTITPNTDKAQVFAGIRKLSDAAAAVFMEYSASWIGNIGSFILTAPGTTAPSGNYGSASRGNIAFDANQAASTGTISAPVTNVVTVTHDIAGDLTVIRSNGGQLGTATGDKGTGNFLAYPAYIYGRAGTSLPFNGLDFGHAVRFGPNLDAATIARVESLIARNTPEVTL